MNHIYETMLSLQSLPVPKTSCRALYEGDWYPFYREFTFGIESGGANDVYMEHSRLTDLLL